MRRASLWLILLLSGCRRDRGEDDSPTTRARARGVVVAKVNGASIGMEQVRELMTSTGLGARDALGRLPVEGF